MTRCIKGGMCGYVSYIANDTVTAYEQIEQNRQALMRGEATPGALAYARFLVACENDATISHGAFKGFRYSDKEVIRRWPFLKEVAESK